MRKLLLQWGAPGILFLIGLGVDMMPGNTSWVPSFIILGIAFIWLIGAVAYWLIKERNHAKKSIVNRWQDAEKLSPLVKMRRTILGLLNKADKGDDDARREAEIIVRTQYLPSLNQALREARDQTNESSQPNSDKEDSQKK